MQPNVFLVWDVGGTKCAAAVIQFDAVQNALECVASCRVPLRECDSVEALVDRVERELSIKASEVNAICIAAAGLFNGEEVELAAGYPFSMAFGRVARERGWQNWEVVHDYVPVACATFTEYLGKPGHVKVINEGVANPYGRRVVLGLGTGLGLKDAVQLPDGNFWLGSNEAGHVGLSFPPLARDHNEDRHREFIKFLRFQGGLDKGEVLTFEKILSGSGLTRIHQFVTGMHGCSPEEIGAQMTQGDYEETLKMLAWYLGLFVGSVQLMFMPSGGIWMTGGVVQKNLAVCDQDEFIHGIYASPAYQKDREQFPLYVMCAEDYALMGCAYYASKRLLSTSVKEDEKVGG